MRILSVSITQRGAALAAQLPWETAHGGLGPTVRSEWGSTDGFVLFCAVGVAVRVVGPLLADKETNPAVVCVDETGTYAVAVCGGHAGGANDLAREVAALLGAQPVITTATDATGVGALDSLVGFRTSGDVAAVTRALLDGQPIQIVNTRGWPLPTSLQPADCGPILTVSDTIQTGVTLHPPSLVVGVGTSSDAPADSLITLVGAALVDNDLAWQSVSAVATIDRRRDAPAVVALASSLDAAIEVYPATTLAEVEVPNPSDAVAAAVGTPSVAEAAAITAAGADATLIVTKRTSPHATVAVARRARPAGHLAIVGLGPGDARHRTPAATAALRHASVVIGYGPYVDQAADAIAPGATVQRSPIGDEVGRSAAALAAASAGNQVALVCSGDAGVYALATLVFELAGSLTDVPEIHVIPGVTAALAAASVLGAPLGHDHAAISLSDLLTPWEVIVSRLEAAASADLVVSLYNPRSKGRDWQLPAAISIFAAQRPPGTPVGVVTDAGRDGETSLITTIADFDPTVVGMTTCVVIGASSTRVVRGHMVTPRGYTP